MAYHKAMADERIFSKKLLAAKEAGRTLVQPRAGVPLISEHIKLLEHLQDEGEADLLPTTIDSYTRQNRYEEAENGIRESMRLNRAMLNGFPAVNHGQRLPPDHRERPHPRPGPPRYPGRPSAHGDHLRRRLHQLRGRRHFLQPALLQEHPHGAHHPRLAVRGPSDRPL